MSLLAPADVSLSVKYYLHSYLIENNNIRIASSVGISEKRKIYCHGMSKVTGKMLTSAILKKSVIFFRDGDHYAITELELIWSSLTVCKLASHTLKSTSR